MIKTNKERIPIISVIGEISMPIRRFPYTISHEGELFAFPGTGGITYNVKVGDKVFGWVGDHIEPGVSIKLKDENENRALNTYACIGNEAIVVSGDAKGSKGYVTGKHGGIEHILVYFSKEVLEKLVIGDKIQIKARGQGLKIEDLDEVIFYNLDPDLLERMTEIGLRIKNGILFFPVTHIISPEIMGSGLGSIATSSGDYDITTQDEESIKKYGLEDLRFGDIVALQNTDNRYGRCLKKGAISIGVVVHSNCVIAGHGPGVTTIATSVKGKIKPVKNKKANIGYLLGILE